MVKRRIILVFLLWAFAVSSAFAQKPDPAQRVRAAYQAEGKLQYSGTLRTTTFSETGELSAEVVVYRKGGMARYEYRLPEGQSTVLIEKGDVLIRLYPSTRTALVETVHRSPITVDLLLKNYQAMLVGQEHLLARQVDVLLLKPRADSGPSRKLWVDRRTGLILRSEQYNSAGKLVSRSAYISVNWQDIPNNSLFDVPEDWKQVTSPVQSERHRDKAELSSRLGFTVREPSYVPSGFVLDGFHLVHHSNIQASAHIRYVDGLNSISIFQHRFPPGRGRGFQWGRRMGSQNSIARFTSAGENMLVKEGRGIRIVVVGDLPTSELQKVMDSLR